MSWDPAQYLKFAGERMRPALDLLARIPAWYPPEADGRTLFPFRRLFLVARR